MLEYVRSDFWGPSRTTTMGGTRYFMSVIDDYSRKLWILLLKTKDEAFHAFKEWKKLVENQSWLKVKKLRTENAWSLSMINSTTFAKSNHKT